MSQRVPRTGKGFLSRVTHSADLREECRFILLGGDDFAKKKACNFILRNGQNQERADLEQLEVMENCVQGRKVTVANTPSQWLDHTISLPNGIKAIKNDIQECISKVFPGPNAFLLVIRNGCDPGKAHRILEAVASVFGKEALDCSMVLFVTEPGERSSEPDKLKCVKKCGERHHFLENTDRSVQELFHKVEHMVHDKKSKFFIPSVCADFMKTEFDQWEKKRILYMNNLLAECKEEKDKRIEELEKRLNASQLRESELEKKLNASQLRESELEKKMNASQLREGELEKRLNASQIRESELKKKMNASHLRESELKKKMNASQLRESELKKKMNVSHLRESELKKKMNASQLRERELEKDLKATQLRENKLKKELDDIRRNECNPGEVLDHSQQRQSEVRKEDGCMERNNKEQEPQHTGARERRGSKDIDPPNFSTDQSGYLDTL